MDFYRASGFTVFNRIADGDPDIQQPQSGNNAAHNTIRSQPGNLRNEAEKMIVTPGVGPRQCHNQQAKIEPDDNAKKKIDPP